MMKIQGTVSEINYYKEENGYMIAKLIEDNKKEIITIAGCLPTICVGESIEVFGKISNTINMDQHFEVNKFNIITPTSFEGIYAYLTSGLIKGIGGKLAELMINKFGVETLNILQNEPDRLSEVEGIGFKKVELIKKSYADHKQLRDIVLKLTPYGITPAVCMKIFNTYKNKTNEVLSKNPYVIAEDIRSIDFKTADKMALEMGINKHSKNRLMQGILHILSDNTNKGHTFLPEEHLIAEAELLLEVEKKFIQEAISKLLSEGKIKKETSGDTNNIYLTKYYLCESNIASKLLELNSHSVGDLSFSVRDEIKNIERLTKVKLATKQKLAIKECIKNGVTVITGGPGTGKTTTLNFLIRIFENNDKKVILCAPTGRAAKRMSETSGRDAKTIHRLLEIGFSSGPNNFVFLKNEANPLDADVIILDESSMIDLVMMDSLLKAIQIGTKLIIVGDSDQLPAVGAGNVLKDIILSNIVKTVKLDEIFRQAQESMIVVNAHNINNGKNLILNMQDKDFFFMENYTPKDTIEDIVNLLKERLPNYYNVDSSKDIQVLTTMRKGELGVNRLNKKLQKHLNPPHKYKQEEDFKFRTLREEDKVMQVKNSYNRPWTDEINRKTGEGIYNGEIGYITHIDKSNKIVYVTFDETKVTAYKYSELDEIEHSYCTTIHKSQGSEFPVVVIPLSWAPDSLLNRNLLYTAVTRAKQLVVLVGEFQYLEKMMSNTNVNSRYSDLKNKLIEYEDAN